MEKIIQKLPSPRTVSHRHLGPLRHPLDDGLLKIPMVAIVEKSQ